MKNFFLFLSLLLTGFVTPSCDKEPMDPPDDTPTDTGYKQYGTPYDDMPDNEDVVIYEVNLRAFSSSGTLQGVTDRLDEIQSLGVNVIWLMPIHPIGNVNSVNSPYSVRDFKAVSSEYGSLEDLRSLTDEAHSRGMAVIMDWIANHTAWDNSWTSNKDWYTQDADGNIIHPPGTNWMDVADLNYDNTDMQEEMIDVMKYWVLEANVDGYRCDYADGVPYTFWTRAIDSLEAIPNRELLLLAEGSRANHFDAGFDLNFGFSFYGSLIQVFDGAAPSVLFNQHASDYATIPADKEWLRYTTNHDESAWNATPISIYGGVDGALAASVINIFIGGTPMFYTGQEVGTANTVPFFSNSQINWSGNPDMYAEYQTIMDFYSNYEAAREDSNTVYEDADVACFTKERNGEKLLIIVNVRDAEINFQIPAALQNSDWDNALSGGVLSLGTNTELKPFEYLILSQ
ncbi:MAG: alpha-amylase [Bacteroidetes bacterium]|nr:alpha-amylase [Bacteroidota bacterium]